MNERENSGKEQRGVRMQKLIKEGRSFQKRVKMGDRKFTSVGLVAGRQRVL